MKDEDFVEKLFVAHTHDTILCFSNRGKVYWKRVFELPQAGRGSRGKPMVNLLPLEEGECPALHDDVDGAAPAGA